MTERARLWWDAITGPRSFVREVVRGMRQRGSVCLVVPDDLPWRGEMRGAVEQEFGQSEELGGFYVDFIDVDDDCPEVEDVGRYLLDRYAEPTVASGFRSRSTIQKYIADHHALEGRVLWVKGMNEQQERHWLKFCQDYAPFGARDVRFVVESRNSSRMQERRNMAVIQFNERVKEHDLLLFNSLYLNQNQPKLDPLWQQYASVLCANLCDTDAETSVALMEALDVRNQEPLTALQAVAENPEFARRGAGNERHILNLTRRSASADEAEAAEAREAIDALVWEAQLQVFFPLLEVERMNFVKRYRSEIAAALRAEYCNLNTGECHRIRQFGELIESPEDAEWGALFFMNQHYLAEDTTQRMLALRDRESFDQLCQMHQMRNALAHGDCCPVEAIDRFIESYPYQW